MPPKASSAPLAILARRIDRIESDLKDRPTIDEVHQTINHHHKDCLAHFERETNKIISQMTFYHNQVRTSVDSINDDLRRAQDIALKARSVCSETTTTLTNTATQCINDMKNNMLRENINISNAAAAAVTRINQTVDIRIAATEALLSQRNMTRPTNTTQPPTTNYQTPTTNYQQPTTPDTPSANPFVTLQGIMTGGGLQETATQQGDQFPTSTEDHNKPEETIPEKIERARNIAAQDRPPSREPPIQQPPLPRRPTQIELQIAYAQENATKARSRENTPTRKTLSTSLPPSQNRDYTPPRHRSQRPHTPRAHARQYTTPQNPNPHPTSSRNPSPISECTRTPSPPERRHPDDPRSREV